MQYGRQNWRLTSAFFERNRVGDNGQSSVLEARDAETSNGAAANKHVTVNCQPTDERSHSEEYQEKDESPLYVD